MFLALALVEILQARENQRTIRSASSKAESRHSKSTVHLRNFGEDCLHLRANIRCVFERRAFRALHCDDEITPVFSGDEAFRHVLVNPVCKAESTEKEEHGDEFKTQKESQKLLVALSKGRHSAVESCEEAVADHVSVSQKYRGQRRRKSESVECRD